MAEEYKLMYFNIRGLAEPIRLLLIDNNIPFTDEKFTFEQWSAIKPNMPFGQVPCFYHNGIPLAQSGAIIRHLARKHDLYGSDLASAAFIDMMYEGIGDLRKKYYDLIYRDLETRESFVNKTAQEELQKLEKLQKCHPSYTEMSKAGHYVLGDKISFVDYALFEALDMLLTLDSKILDNSHLLKAYHQNMMKRPKLAEYLNSATRKDMKINGNGKQ